MSEKDKYGSAFAVAVTAGAKLDAIINSIEVYKVKLAEELARFEQAVVDQKANEIDTRQKTKSDNETSIQQMYAKITELNEQITAKNAENTQLSIEINEQTAKVANVETSFSITYNTVVQQLDEDKQKISMYLSTTTTPTKN